MTTTTVHKSYISLTKPELVRATIRGLKTETRRVMTKVNSEMGPKGDWTKLCWDGSEIAHDEGFADLKFIKIDRPAPQPWKDGFPDTNTGEKNYQYLHVPYNWAEDETVYRVYSKWEPGQLLGIKESWGIADFSKKFPGRLQVVYRAGVSDIDHPNGNDADRLWRDVDDATWQNYAFKNQWRGPRFMPAWAVRLWVQVESVRPERIQEITWQGVEAEGTPKNPDDRPLTLPSEIERVKDYAILWDAINGIRNFGEYTWERNPWVWVLKYRLVSSTGLQAAAL